MFHIMTFQTKERINNLIDMNDYFTSIANDVDLFNGVINGRILEIPSLILEKEDALEFTKIICDEVDTGMFKATVNISPSQNCILVTIGITVVAVEVANLSSEGTKELVKKGFRRLIAKFKRKGMEIMEKERKYSDSDQNVL
jgi:hypothetical protein